jgi:hypothetical protein
LVHPALKNLQGRLWSLNGQLHGKFWLTTSLFLFFCWVNGCER